MPRVIAICFATAVLAVAGSTIGIRALATENSSTPVGYDEAVVASSSDEAGAYVAISRYDRTSDAVEVVVSKLQDGSRPRLNPLPSPPEAAEADGSRAIELANRPGGTCVLYSVSAAPEPVPTISCFTTTTNNWTLEAALASQVKTGELVNALAARGEDLFVSITSKSGVSARVIKLSGSVATDLGVVAASRHRGLFVDFNAEASAEETIPTISVERNLGHNRSGRVIRQFANGKWSDATRTIKSVYPAQSGGAARSAGRWVVAESRSLSERGISSFAVRATARTSGAWRVLSPANVAATRGYSQGNAFQGGNRPWIAWSEQGRMARAGVPMRIYVARAVLRRDRVSGRQLLWSGRMKAFPPVPRVMTVGLDSYAAFERPVGREQSIRATVMKLK